jgi:hypothetical protein
LETSHYCPRYAGANLDFIRGEGFSDDSEGTGRGLVLVRNKEKPSMKIIGCDFHPSWQQIAVFETETGEITEHKLVNGNGEGERF